MEDDSFIYNYAPYQTLYNDVRISIGVFPNYIQYNTECPGLREDCGKFYYKVDGENLYVKAFEFGLRESGGSYEMETFFFLQNGKMNAQVVEKYIQWYLQEMSINSENPKSKKSKRRLAKRKIGRIETKSKRHQVKNWYEIDYILNKIKEKDFDKISGD